MVKPSDKYSIEFKELDLGVYDFSFDVDSSFFEAFPESEVKVGNAHIDVQLTKHANFMELEVEVEGEVEVICDRCLEPFMMPIGWSGGVIVKYSEEETEDDEDVIWLSPEDSTLDLSQFIYESILLAIPYQRVHPKDKKGDPTCNKDMLSRITVMDNEELSGGVVHMEPNDEDSEWTKSLEKLKEEMEKK